MAQVTLRKGTTSLCIDCLPNGRLAENPSLEVFKFLQLYLTEYEYDYYQKRNRAKYYYYKYDRINNVLILPVNILDTLVKYLNQYLIDHVVICTQPFASKSIQLTNISNFEDRDYQVRSIDFLKKPGMRALELQTGCLVGNTTNIVFEGKNKSKKMKLSDAYNIFNNAKTNRYLRWFSFIPEKVLSYNGHSFFFNEIEDIIYSGKKECLRLTFEDGITIECTIDHMLLTELGWIEAKDILNQVVIGTYDMHHYVFVSRQVCCVENIGVQHTYDIRCKSPHHNFVANDVVVHNSGKTYVAVRTLLELQKRAVIVVPASLMNQWQDAITSMTNANVDIIRGSRSIKDIIAQNFDVNTDIFLTSVNTIQEYARRDSDHSIYKDLPSCSSFVEQLGIGVKIIDECHINFNSNLLVDIICGNVEHNIYLSATYIRSSRASNAIFNRIFPSEVKYDGDRDYNRYVNITEVKYNLGNIDEKLVTTERGYSQFKYEKYLLKKVSRLNYVIQNVIACMAEDYFVDIREKGEKLLILVGMQEFAEFVVAYLSNSFPSMHVISFLYRTKDEAIEDADIIVSTIGSCGTGRDIKGLRTVILFSSFSSDALTMQTIGRLRKMKNTPEFLYLVNTGIQSQCRHAHTKQRTYKYIGLSFRTITI